MEMKTIFNPELYYQVHADPSKFELTKKTESLDLFDKKEIKTKNREIENHDPLSIIPWLI
jgi:hypothetical protein